MLSKEDRSRNSGSEISRNTQTSNSIEMNGQRPVYGTINHSDEKDKAWDSDIKMIGHRPIYKDTSLDSDSSKKERVYKKTKLIDGDISIKVFSDALRGKKNKGL